MKIGTAVLLVLTLVISATAFAGSGKIRRFPDAIEGAYIVSLSAGFLPAEVRPAANALLRAGDRLGWVWENGIPGFVIYTTEERAQAISATPWVKSVDQDVRVYPASYTTTTDTAQSPYDFTYNKFWNLDRIDQATGLDNTMRGCYTGKGAKIYIVDYAVLKTHREFWTTSTDSTTRVVNGVSKTTSDSGAPYDVRVAPGDTADYGTNPCGILNGDGIRNVNDGHGTAVASVAAGVYAGVAKQATIVPVKVIPCGGGGKLSDVIEGLKWIRAEHAKDNAADPLDPPVRSIVNMSIYYLLPSANPDLTDQLGRQLDVYGPDEDATQLSLFEQETQGLVSDGIHIAVSANNQNMDALNTSPARLAYGNGAISGAHVISVGATEITPPTATEGAKDSRWVSPNDVWQPYYRNADGSLRSDTNVDPASNWGIAVDIFAPGDNVEVAHIDGTNGPNASYRTTHRSGTSFASPLVAGLIARRLIAGAPESPSAMWSKILNYSTINVLDASSLGAGSPNRLLFNWSERCSVIP